MTGSDESRRDRDPSQHGPDHRQRDLRLTAQLGDADFAANPALELIDDADREQIEGKTPPPSANQPPAGVPGSPAMTKKRRRAPSARVASLQRKG